MTSKQFCLGGAALATLLFSPAVAQVTSSNATGPTITIDVLRVAGPGSRPAIDPVTGGITYTVGVTPDASFPVFGGGAGPNGPGASIAAELGLVVGGAGLSDDLSAPSIPLPIDPGGQVIVNANSTPGSGSSATEPGDGFVDFANPGNPIFGFEVPNIPVFGGLQPGGVQVGVSGGSDAIFAALGTTFFDASTIGDAPFELFRVRTAQIDFSDLDALVPSLTLVAGSLTAQAIDLSDVANPIAQVFPLPVTASEPFFVRDVIPEPASAALVATAVFFAASRRRSGRRLAC